jgi:hypothetical protein
VEASKSTNQLRADDVYDLIMDNGGVALLTMGHIMALCDVEERDARVINKILCTMFLKHSKGKVLVAGSRRNVAATSYGIWWNDIVNKSELLQGTDQWVGNSMG